MFCVLPKLNLPGLKCPCKIHGNIHAKKSIHLKILEWTSMVHGHGMDTRIFVFFNEWIIWQGHFNPGCFSL